MTDTAWRHMPHLHSISAVTIIVVTIFIATFQNYRIAIFPMRAERYICAALAMQTWSIQHQSTQVSARCSHASITWRERRDAWLPPGDRGWAASPSVKDAATAFEVTCRWWSPWPEPSLWRHSSQLPAYVCLRCRFQVSVLSSVSMGKFKLEEHLLAYV